MRIVLAKLVDAPLKTTFPHESAASSPIGDTQRKMGIRSGGSTWGSTLR